MLFSHDLHIVFIYTALVMFICAFALPIECTTPFCLPPLLGCVVNPCGNSDFEKLCSCNLAIFILFFSIAHSVEHN